MSISMSGYSGRRGIGGIGQDNDNEILPQAVATVACKLDVPKIIENMRNADDINNEGKYIPGGANVNNYDGHRGEIVLRDRSSKMVGSGLVPVTFNVNGYSYAGMSTNEDLAEKFQFVGVSVPAVVKASDVVGNNNGSGTAPTFNSQGQIAVYTTGAVMVNAYTMDNIEPGDQIMWDLPEFNVSGGSKMDANWVADSNDGRPDTASDRITPRIRRYDPMRVRSVFESVAIASLAGERIRKALKDRVLSETCDPNKMNTIIGGLGSIDRAAVMSRAETMSTGMAFVLSAVTRDMIQVLTPRNLAKRVLSEFAKDSDETKFAVIFLRLSQVLEKADPDATVKDIEDVIISVNQSKSGENGPDAEFQAFVGEFRENFMNAYQSRLRLETVGPTDDRMEEILWLAQAYDVLKPTGSSDEFRREAGTLEGDALVNDVLRLVNMRLHKNDNMVSDLLRGYVSGPGSSQQQGLVSTTKYAMMKRLVDFIGNGRHLGKLYVTICQEVVRSRRIGRALTAVKAKTAGRLRVQLSS